MVQNQKHHKVQPLSIENSVFKADILLSRVMSLWPAVAVTHSIDITITISNDTSKTTDQFCN